MIWTVEWDGGFVVGGDDNRRLTPNFRLKEFRAPDGTVRVHRELVSALQMLRDRYGKSLAIRSTDDGVIYQLSDACASFHKYCPSLYTHVWGSIGAAIHIAGAMRSGFDL